MSQEQRCQFVKRTRIHYRSQALRSFYTVPISLHRMSFASQTSLISVRYFDPLLFHTFPLLSLVVDIVVPKRPGVLSEVVRSRQQNTEKATRLKTIENTRSVIRKKTYNWVVCVYAWCGCEGYASAARNELRFRIVKKNRRVAYSRLLFFSRRMCWPFRLGEGRVGARESRQSPVLAALTSCSCHCQRWKDL
ncbi:hypothetical protein H4582DRAFT_461287 [Lactarius indigo]|nr:hypothetical protein H4582DRAFT_461287 [Lactarius indigo]